MPLPEPVFDSRTYRELLDDALARVPVHTPEWTNLSPSDPGVTLLQLFAFLSESIIYRANRIPARNRQKFLRLLGIPMRPATAARGLVEFSNPNGPLARVTVGAGERLRAGKVPFTTEAAVEVLPIEAAYFYKLEIDAESDPARHAEVDDLYGRLYAAFDDVGDEPAYYETRQFAPPAAGVGVPTLDLAETLDNSLWIALLMRDRDQRLAPDPEDAKTAVRMALAGKVLSVGIMPPLDADGKVLYPLPPSLAGGATLAFERPAVPLSSLEAPAYLPLETAAEVDALSRPGVIELPLPTAAELTTWTSEDPLIEGVGDLPPRIEDDRLRSRVITWLRLRRVAPDGTLGSNTPTRLSWVGINATTAVQRTQVPAELLARGTGEPDQQVTIANTPVISDSLQLTVNGEPWRLVDDLAIADPEVAATPRLAAHPPAPAGGARAGVETVKLFSLDSESGVVGFGDGARGMRPPRGAYIQARYDYGGGPAGMVAIDAINRHEGDSGLKVRNPVPTWGASAAETVDQAQRRIPSELRHRGQLVSAQDYREIALAAPGVELGRVEVLPLVGPAQPRQTSPGVVTIIVVPRRDPQQPDAPRPDSLVLETICRHLEPRRILTTELHIRGPEYVQVWVSIGIEVAPGAQLAEVRPALVTAVKRFLSPLAGGFAEAGWDLGKSVEDREILAAAARVPGVAQINGVALSRGGTEASANLALEPLQLPRVMAVAVAAGEPPPLADIVGARPPEDKVINRRPVPIVPEEC